MSAADGAPPDAAVVAVGAAMGAVVAVDAAVGAAVAAIVAVAAAVGAPGAAAVAAEVGLACVGVAGAVVAVGALVGDAADGDFCQVRMYATTASICCGESTLPQVGIP